MQQPPPPSTNTARGSVSNREKGRKVNLTHLSCLIAFKGPFMRDSASGKCFKPSFAVPQAHAQLIFFPSFGRSRLHSSSTPPQSCCLGPYYIFPVEHTDGGAGTCVRAHTHTDVHCSCNDNTTQLHLGEAASAAAAGHKPKDPERSRR